MKVYYVNTLDLHEEPSDSRDVGVVYSSSAQKTIEELEQYIAEIKQALTEQRKDYEIDNEST